MTKPNYTKIYSDLIENKFPERKDDFLPLLLKDELTTLDIIRINSSLFGTKDRESTAFDQMHRMYDRFTILEILEYQKKNDLSNTQLANHFRLSRNTVAKWKKKFLV
ncbi:MULTISPECIES: helix-turn-helix domain-containing protein [unclassified Chryseobacterium]|uniref:helix-turn-helix domain-containing protein n=1 Tax=unclassified Chryseobacterium TaxID=2593645 RepID=UPI00301002DD